MPSRPNPPAQEAQALLSRMTLEEKAAQMMQIPLNLVTAEEAEAWALRGAGSFLHALGERAATLQRLAAETRLGIPLLFGIDAVRGHALNRDATVFPCPLAMACSWDDDLLLAVGRATGAEVAADGLHWTFSPLLCQARDLRWGRVDETFGESRVLVGNLAAAMIRGYQGEDLAAPDSILACAKHYLAYGESLGGRDSVDTPVSMRVIREQFLPPFAQAVRAGCATFMTAYHAVDGVPMTIHRELLTQVLKEELGFDGFVVTDWDNVRSLVARQHVADDMAEASRLAALAGNDLFMSTPEACDGLIKAVREGTLAESVLDAAVLRILSVKLRLGLFGEKRFAKPNPAALGTPEHRALSARAQEEALVLLKNSGALPLSARRVAVIGPAADDGNALLGDWTYLSHPDPNPRAQHAAPPVTPLAGLTRLAREKGFALTYARGCGFLTGEPVTHPFGANSPYDAEIERMRAPLDREAVLAACEGADAVVAFVGDFLAQNGEARDRANLDLSGDQPALLELLGSLGKPLTVVLVSGKPLTVPWVARHADAVVQAFHGGQTLGDALARLLTGEINPMGKLPVTFARHAGQLPVYHNQLPGWHDGRYMDLPAEPLYPFGWGLSYTRYRYGAPRLSETEGGRVLTATLRNVGERDGVEIVQVYAHRPSAGRMTPVKELVAYRRVPLRAGEETELTLPIPDDLLCAVRDDGTRALEKGEYTLMLGSSSRDADLQWVRFRV
ncbi:MAG: glycosyl hydrolase [Clostridiales bacterium]|nr:glycosyl hydrolase [Clostridiales bacterium]